MEQFSFTLNGGAYLRYNSYNSVEELKKDILDKCPIKIDIGPIYTARPADKRSLKPSEFKPVEKELVFDIDMTDYDEIRTYDFGFKHLLWVYSGRRGVHCWVCDEIARELNDSERKAIVSYLEVIEGGAQAQKRVDLRGHLHPSISRSLSIINQYFDDLILKDQDVLKDENCWNKVLGCIPNEEIKNTLTKHWLENPSQTSSDRWKNITDELNKKNLPMCKNEIILQYAYPRLDRAVSTTINHLLKSPFCIHPDTGRVCVPILPETCDDFDPLSSPTVRLLIDELERAHAIHPVTKDFYSKTSLKSHIKYFNEFFRQLPKEVHAAFEF
ncbi:15024_t:CDS:10 [Entrophospora sp. SA101]|nr:15024_t:CDS:10 [Entrophospora sp. SA101]